MKKNILADILNRLKKGNWLAQEKKEKDVETLLEEALRGDSHPLMGGAHFLNIIEFGRSVHAEMAALIDAAHRGVAVKKGILYTTTFPCHDCAKHIVAAGIRRVVYIEPYPKSLVPELYLDSIIVDSPKGIYNQVSFEPFVGIAPRRYMDLFSMAERKKKDGKVIDWDKSKAVPRLTEYFPSYFVNLIKEQEEFKRFERQLKEKGLR